MTRGLQNESNCRFFILLILLEFRAIDKGREIPEGFTQPFDSVVLHYSTSRCQYRVVFFNVLILEHVLQQLQVNTNVLCLFFVFILSYTIDAYTKKIVAVEQLFWDYATPNLPISFNITVYRVKLFDSNATCVAFLLLNLLFMLKIKLHTHTHTHVEPYDF